MKNVAKISLALFVIGLIGLFFTKNLIFSYLIEQLGTKAVGALVEVDGAKISLFKGRANWDRLQITDRANTWTNIAETGECAFDIAITSLMSGKFIVEHMIISGFKTGTNRTSDGKIESDGQTQQPSWLKEVVVKKLEEEKKNIPILGPDFFEKTIDTDTIIETLQLVTPGNVEKLNTFADERFLYWDKRLKKNDYETRIKTLKHELKEIEHNTNKTVKGYRKAIVGVDGALKKIKKLRRDVKRERKEFKEDVRKIKEMTASIPDWLEHDYNMAIKKANLPDFTEGNISKLLFGERLTTFFIKVMTCIDTVRMISGGKQGALSEANQEHSNKKNANLPELWIKHLEMDAVFKQTIPLGGVIENISTNQKITGKPISFDINGGSMKTGIIKVNGTLDYTGKQTLDEVKITVNHLPMTNIKLGNSSLFPGGIEQANATIAAGISVMEKSFWTQVEFEVNDIKFNDTSTNHSSKKTARIAKRISEKLEKINVKCTAEAKDDTMNIHLESNVDDIIATEVRSAISDEISSSKRRLKQTLNQKIGGFQGETEKKIDHKEKGLGRQIALLEEVSEEQENRIETKKKALERKIRKKAKKAGKDLLKKMNIKF